MTSRSLLGVLGVCLVAVVGYGFVHVITHTEVLGVARPVLPPIAEMGFEAPESNVLVPFEISIDRLSQEAEAAVPHSIRGEKGLPNMGPAARNSVRWNFTRNEIVGSESNGRMNLTTKIAGSATLKGRVQPIRGSIGKLLGKLKPSVPYSQTVRLAADVHASAVPELTKNWRLRPNIHGNVRLTEARARIAKVVDLSLKGTLQGDVDSAVAREIRRINEKVAQDVFLEAAARDAWMELCKPISLGMVGDESLFLVVEPLDFLAMQPRISKSSINLVLGLRARTALISSGPANDSCTEFPQELRIVQDIPDESVVAVDTELSYSVVNEVLRDQVQREGVVEAHGAVGEIKAVTLEPFGTRLLATVEGVFRETRFFGVRVEGKLFFELEPTLDEERQIIQIEHVKIGASSDQALGKVAAGALMVLATSIENRLQHVTVDLKPLIEKERVRATKALMGLSTGQDAVEFSNASITDIRLEELRIGYSGIRILVLVRGSLGLVVRELT